MKAIINGKILLTDREIDNKILLFNEKIVDITNNKDELKNCSDIIDAHGKYVSPGFIDTHIHGYDGYDVCDQDPEAIEKMSEGLAKNGVTSWLPTTITLPWESTVETLKKIRILKKESKIKGFKGSQILGAHVEGPFINPAKKGAQPEEFIQKPEFSKIAEYLDVIKIISLAPEIENGFEFIKETKEKSNINLSIAHTQSNYEQAKKAIELGCNRATHTFNAMPPLHHRNPGCVGAVLNDDRVFCELIADTYHVHKGLFELFTRIKGNKLVLITDSMRACNMPEGVYTLGGQKVYIKDNKCTLANGTIASSVIKLNEAVHNLYKNTTVEFYQAVACASANAAKSIGCTNKGTLKNGRDADIIIMDENCNIYRTIINGNTVYLNQSGL